MRPALLWIACVLVAVTALGFTAPMALSAKRAASAESVQLVQVRRLVDRIADRRKGSVNLPRDDGARQSLPERLAASVAAAGLAKGALVSVSPGQEEAVGPDHAVVRQHASVSLGGLTLPELGRLFERWRAAEPAWVVTGIDLAPEPKNKAEPGGDLPLRANLTLERLTAGAVYE